MHNSLAAQPALGAFPPRTHIGVLLGVGHRTAVVGALDRARDPTIIAEQCGHTVDTSINVYNKVGIERQLAAVQQLDNALQTTTHST